jgi:hypothetical protein
MKLALKIIGQNHFDVYEVTDNDRVLIGTYKGSIATVRRLVSKDIGISSSNIIIIKSLLKGWY